MEIDHFNPELKGYERHRYDNLFLSTRHCNGAKSSTWPSKAARKKGIHFLNPCAEMDYGVHIFEHPLTHRLIGVTPSGDFHITMCDLNASQFIQERADRAAIHNLLENTVVTAKKTFFKDEFLQPIKLLREQFEKMIPLIPYLPPTHPAYHEEMLLMKELSNSTN